MVRRTHSLEKAGSPEALEQVVRDLASLRAHPDNPGESVYTTRIITNLVVLGRLDEACAEAEPLARGGATSFAAFHAVALECVSRGDPRAETWLRRVLELAPTTNRFALLTALVGLLMDDGRAGEALEAFEGAVDELAARRKKTSKGVGGEAFAVGYWSNATKALDTVRKPVVERSAATAAAAGRDAQAEAQRLEGVGDIAAARDAAHETARQLGAMVKRLSPLAAGLSRSDRNEVMEPLSSLLRTLEGESKRLTKLAKRS
jgi:hypothetical protein